MIWQVRVAITARCLSCIVPVLVSIVSRSLPRRLVKPILEALRLLGRCLLGVLKRTLVILIKLVFCMIEFAMLALAALDVTVVLKTLLTSKFLVFRQKKSNT